MAKDTPFVNKLIGELKNEIPEDLALNRHAPVKLQIAKAGVKLKEKPKDKNPFTERSKSI
jgi:hypothetical protein